MVPDTTESGSFEITESMPSPDKMTKKLIKLNFVLSAIGIMKKSLKILLYTLCMILIVTCFGAMTFLLVLMTVIAIVVMTYTMSMDKGGEPE